MRRVTAGGDRSAPGMDGRAKSRRKCAQTDSARGEDCYYREAMNATVLPAVARGFARLFAWRRLRYTFIAGFLWSLLLSIGWTSSYASLLFRTLLISLVLMLLFGFFERWPRRPPRWIARWVLQVVSIAFSLPFIVAIIYWLSTPDGAPPFYTDSERMDGYSVLTGTGLLFAPWVAMTALMRGRDSQIRSQAVAFERERGELERKATAARMRLLQAQVQPHFLFNTLANVRELVDSGSPQASSVLNNLIAYLRAAVPRLQDPFTTIGQEVELVRAYLELMHMRMPDRLQFAIDVDDTALELRCPPMTLMTLVENAVRHGIDPSEVGGRIDVDVRIRDGRVRAQVLDTGVGMRDTGKGLGTGLTTLRERLQLEFGGDAHMQLLALEPQGVSAEVYFPARKAAA